MSEYVRLLGKYRNGNYNVSIFSDGTKIRRTEEDLFIPAFAESCDVKITDKCDGGCPYCYEGCTPNGKHGDILNAKFLDTLHPFTELAINGNDLSHPDLVPFLKMMKEKQVIVNITLNQKHFEQNLDFIQNLAADWLIHGLGISLVEPTSELVNKISIFKNAVVHVINGIFSQNDMEMLADHDLKLLILGYKPLKRGADYLEHNSLAIVEKSMWLYENIDEIIKRFKAVSFDNLAIKQLDVKRIMSEEEWEEFYMGDDGSATFYIDLVENTFSKSSLCVDRYPILDSVDEMFEIIRKNNGNNMNYIG